MVNEGDDLQKVARAFCLKHGLDPRQTELIAQRIQDAIDGEKNDNDTPRQTDVPIREAALAEEAEHNDPLVSENVDEDEELVGKPAVRSCRSLRPGLSGKKQQEGRTPNEGWEDTVKRRLRETPIMTQNSSPRQTPMGRGYSTASKGQRLATQATSPERPSFIASTERRQLGRRSKSGLNIGDAMLRGQYERGMKKRASLERLAREMRQENEARRLRDVTFAPRINVYSRKMQKPMEERLMESTHVSMERKDKIAAEAYETVTSRCTFAPEVNRPHHVYGVGYDREGRKSKSIQTERGGKRFERLYDDSKKKVDYMQDLAKRLSDRECTFKPSINKGKKATRISLIDRSTEKAKRVAKNLSSTFQEVDPGTGKPMFTPNVGRGPKNRERGNEPIGLYLYSQVKASAKVMDERRQLTEMEERKSANTVMTQEKSSKIVLRLRNEAFGKIFDMLDSDRDGQIRADAIDVTR